MLISLRKLRLRFDIDSKKNHTIFLLLFINATLLTDIIRILFNNDSLTTLFRNFLYILIFFYVVFYLINNKIPKDFLFLVVIFSFLYCYSIFRYSSLIEINYDNLMYMFSRSIPAYFFGRTLYERFIDEKLLIPYVYLAMIYSLLIILQVRDDPSWYMSIAGNIFEPLILALMIAIKWKKKLYYIYFLFFLVVSVIFGSRGYILTTLYAVFLILILYTKLKHKIYITVFVSLLIIFLIINIENILIFMSSVFKNSRNLTMILNNSFLSSTGREIYFNEAIFILKENPLTINGIFTDRVILSNLFDTSVSTGIYPHNFILELLIQFGLIIGFIFSLHILIVFIKTHFYIFKVKYDIFQTFILIIMLTSSLRLFFSGSYLTTPSFWFIIGFYIRIVFLKRRTLYE